MKSGIVFDIKEFAVYDGPGLRCTVFLKGCPLRCSWCHNPEGLAMPPEPVVTSAGVRTAGKEYTSSELIDRLVSYADIFRLSKGGVTFSGGEPLLQIDFLLEVMHGLKG